MDFEIQNVSQEHRHHGIAHGTYNLNMFQRTPVLWICTCNSRLYKFSKNTASIRLHTESTAVHIETVHIRRI